MKRCYYEVLGVDKKSNPDDIKTVITFTHEIVLDLQ